MSKCMAGLAVALLVAGLSPARARGEDAPRQPTAFPGGGGRGRGRRGGSVYRVTNLNASGPGSLADAVSQPHRFVVFSVSGTIVLNAGREGKKSKLAINQPHITIAGQTAPGEGICLKGGALQVNASDVIVRHLRVRRGFIAKGDKGDAVTVKGKGETLTDVMLDHLSASWATDETFTTTGAIDRLTAQYCLASEALDYFNPEQTPNRHAFGSLFGSSVKDGRVSYHHMLFAHHRRRCPQFSLADGQGPTPSVLDLRNSIVYDCSEATTHNGGGGIRGNVVNNTYKAGPSTPETLRHVAFTFQHNPEARLYLAGNQIDGDPAGTKQNALAVRYAKGLTPDAKFLVDREFPVPAVATQSAQEAYETVLAETGATLPARDAVDLRITDHVRKGTGKVIERETDLPAENRWPTYHSLPPPLDTDGDGLPDYWEEQFGLDKKDAKDGMALGHGGYANIEHYCNNTDPKGGRTPIVSIAARVSRAREKDHTAGVLRVARSGSTNEALSVRYQVGGSAKAGSDYEALSGRATIPAGQSFVDVAIVPRAASPANGMVVVTLEADGSAYHRGCPAAALVVLAE